MACLLLAVGLAASLRAVPSGVGGFIAVGSDGTIITSADGSAWTARTSGTLARLRAAAYKPGIAIVVGEAGTVLTSADGSTWSSVTSGISDGLRGAASNGSVFVAVGGQTAGRVFTSADGSSWSEVTLGFAAGKLRGVVYNGSQFVAVGAGGTILTSSDGLSWTDRTSGGITERLDGVVWTGTYFFILTQSGKLHQSSDGVSWGAATDSNAPAWAEGMAWSSGRVVFVGANGRIRTSDNGSTYTWRSSGLANTVTLHGVAYAGVFSPQVIAPATLFGSLRTLTVSGITASNKEYDGATSATLDTSSAALVGVFSGDTVTLSTGSAAGAFATSSVGSAKAVTISGLSISGANAGDYTLTQPSATADITAKAVTVTGVTASNKTYDGGTTATPSFSSSALSGVLLADLANVTLASGSATASFANKAIGSGKTVTVAGLTLSGSAASNYSLTQPSTTANITAKGLTVTGTTAPNKTYDGNTSATPAFGSSALFGVVPGDTVTLVTAAGAGSFGDKTLGTNKTVTVSGLTITGADAGNYSLTQPTTTANITAKSLSVTGVTASNKIYDRGTTATPSFGSAALSGVVPGDTVTLVTGAGSASFGDKTVATNKTVTIAGLTLSGGDAGNYSLTQPTTTANISVKALTVTGTTASNKVYDGNNTASPAFGGSALSGVISGDTVTLVTASGSATFSDKAVASGKTVTVAGLTLSGADSANYSLTQPTTTANITAKALTVSGTAVTTRAYDGTVAAPLNFSGASLVGVVGGDTVTLVTGSASATYADANAAAGKAVTVIGVSTGGADAGNYSLSQPSGVTGTITPAIVGVGAAPWLRTFDGQPKPVSVTLTGANVPYTVIYDGKTTPPTNAGSYVVKVTLNDPNYSGGADGTLIIQSAAQTLAIKAPPTGQVGTTANVSATASSDLPVTLSVASGGATLANGVLSFNSQGSVTLRATQAGNQNYAAASSEVTISVAGKKSQTITFPTIADRLSNSGAITLAATATSGLPVTYVVQAGPATLAGNVLTLNGSAGRVVIVASQSGDAVWNAAPEVSVSFVVTAAGMNVYFGSVTTPGGSASKVGDIAAALPPNSSSGSLVVVAPAINLSRAIDFTIGSDGRFVQTLVIDVPSGPSADGEPSRAAAPVTVTIRGQLVGGRLSGTIDPLGVSFDAPVLPVTGNSANSAGYYKASSIGSTAGTTYSIVGTNNEVLALSTSGSVTVGGVTKLAADGSFSLQSSTPQGTVVLKGSVDEPTATVAGSLTVGNQVTSFAGVSAVVTRTDRMINLSSRVRLAGPSAVLITGFVIGGTDAKQVAVRGVGPTLSSFGVTGAMADPVLRIYSGSTLVAENDNWSAVDAATFARLGAFALPPGSKDAAVVLTLKPGAYTAQVSGSAAGVALAEIYDASTNPGVDYQRLVNISSRGEVTAGDGLLIGGFVVTGNSPKQLLIRGIGPSLGAFGVSGVLADPRLRVYRDGGILAENDNWSVIPADATSIADAGRRVGAFALQNGSKDAAVIVTLSPGAYTAQVMSNDGSPGTALIEIYELP